MTPYTSFLSVRRPLTGSKYITCDVYMPFERIWVDSAFLIVF